MPTWTKPVEQIKQLKHVSWETFQNETGAADGLRRVNNSLFNAIRWGRKRIEKDKLVDPVKVGIECRNRVQKVMDKLPNIGFCDTEPQCHLCELIEKYLDLPKGSIQRW